MVQTMTLTLTLPDSVWLRLNRAAELTNRSVDEIVASAVQVKRYHRHVGVKAVQETVAAKQVYNCTHAMVITNSTFSSQARTLARANQVELWDRDRLTTELLAHQPGQAIPTSAVSDMLPTDPPAKLPGGPARIQPMYGPSVCAVCGKPVSAKVQAYCLEHPERFGGAIYCYDHQKQVGRRAA